MFTGNLSETVRKMREENQQDWTTISSVYYDDREMQNYSSRLRRDDRATAIRVRFYGERSRSELQSLYLERKTHREGWTGEKSCKVCTVQDFLSILCFFGCFMLEELPQDCETVYRW